MTIPYYFTSSKTGKLKVKKEMQANKMIPTSASIVSTKEAAVRLSRRKMLGLLGVSALGLGGFGLVRPGTAEAGQTTANAGLSGRSFDGHLAFSVTPTKNDYMLTVVEVATQKRLSSVALSKAPCIVNYTIAGKTQHFSWLNAQASTLPQTVKATAANDGQVVRPQLMPKLEFGLIFSPAQGELTVINAAQNSVSRQPAQTASWTALSTDGRTAYVSQANARDVIVIDTANANLVVQKLNAV